MKKEELLNRLDDAIRNRENSHYGIYSDIGNALEKFSTEELSLYYIEKFGDGGLRYFLEQHIIANEINKSKK